MMDSPSLNLRLAAEGLGTFLFFFLGFNAVAVASDLGDAAISTLGVALAFGLGLTLAITALGHVSGGHFNPAVSLGLAAARRFPPKEVIPYWIAQLAGGFVSVLAVAAVYPGHAVAALTTAPSARITSGGAFILEFIVTGLFVMVITTVAMDDRAPWQGVMAPLLIGLFIFTAADAVGPASGGSFNPARSLDPALYKLNFAHIWIYLVAPLSGAVLGGTIRTLFGPVPYPKSQRSVRLDVLSEPRERGDKR
jgi:MIP family channel proteins